MIASLNYYRFFVTEQQYAVTYSTIALSMCCTCISFDVCQTSYHTVDNNLIILVSHVICYCLKTCLSFSF